MYKYNAKNNISKMSTSIWQQSVRLMNTVDIFNTRKKKHHRQRKKFVKTDCRGPFYEVSFHGCKIEKNLIIDIINFIKKNLQLATEY